MVCKKRGPTLVAFGPWANTTPGIPAATVAPGDIDVTLMQGDTTTDMFGLTNSGDAGRTLEYTIDTAAVTCASPGPVAWLGRSPENGSVAAGATSMITASIDATSLIPGNHSAFICVHSNDPAHALIAVPVTVTVSLADLIFANGSDIP
jgi:hypothetical protein